ncbi:hypothetical protein LAZ67_14003308 [Cordylochernes scorpioides]|uniref:Gag-like protein n=1 Tax=Cordylochernes scorpioides TaxID=51811 RepID=A0ABY6LA31_9ARAC|nr:hypothetical protein LAZ67_14003308 [Cordylochernes scorpioides]
MSKDKKVEFNAQPDVFDIARREVEGVIDIMRDNVDKNVDNDDEEEIETGRAREMLDRAHRQVTDVADIMRQNLDLVLQRDRELEFLDRRAQNLEGAADHFRVQAQRMSPYGWPSTPYPILPRYLPTVPPLKVADGLAILKGPSKPVPSRVSKPAATQVILHGEKSAAHTVVISDDPQADPREMLEAVRAAHTLPQGVWAYLHTKGKLVLHSSNPDTIPEVTTSLASKLNGMKVRQQKEILPRICLFKVDEETSNSTIEKTFLETAAVRKLPADKVVRVAHRSAPRNGTCTAFIEVDLKTFRALGVRGRIVFDGVILNFEESIRARVCFLCYGFGHNSAQCTRAPKCFHCGEDGHEGRACPSIADQHTSKCANCCSKGRPDKHEARASS